jgi:multicomponent Na+:H+ antiporter subunit F
MISLYNRLLLGALSLMALLLLACVVRAVRGPRTADRLVAVNMMTTLVSLSVCMLAFLFSQGYLADAALIFSLLGGLAVVVLTRVFLSLPSRKPSEDKEAETRVE